MLREAARRRHSETHSVVAMHRRRAMAQAKGAVLAIALLCVCSALLASLYVAHRVSYSQVEQQDIVSESAVSERAASSASAGAGSASMSSTGASLHAADWGSRASAWQLPLGQHKAATAGEHVQEPDLDVSTGGAARQGDFLVVLSVNSSMHARLEASRLLWQVCF